MPVSTRVDDLGDGAQALFEFFVESGFGKTTIARWMFRPLRRVTSYASVSRWMRDRWFPESRPRFAMRDRAA